MNFKDSMRKAASLLFETAEESPSPSPRATSEVDDLLASLDGKRSGSRNHAVNDMDTSNLKEGMGQGQGIPVGAPSADLSTLPLRADGTADTTAIYSALQVPETPFSAEQMLEMLHSLPPELPLEARRQTVKVMLSTLGRGTGTSPEIIVADASRKIAALSECVSHWERTTQDEAAQAEREIAALEAQITAKRAAIGAARTRIGQLQTLCEAEAAKLDDVLEFFSLEVPPSQYAPSSRRNY